MKKQITIYKLTFQEDHNTCFFKGIDALRDFANERIQDGWETKTTPKELEDDDNLIKFITEDYGEHLEILMTITEDDLN